MSSGREKGREKKEEELTLRAREPIIQDLLDNNGTPCVYYSSDYTHNIRAFMHTFIILNRFAFTNHLTYVNTASRDAFIHTCIYGKGGKEI